MKKLKKLTLANIPKAATLDGSGSGSVGSGEVQPTPSTPKPQ